MKQILVFCFLFFSIAVVAQKVNDYKTVKGNNLLWNNPSSWQVFDGKQWVNSTSIPDSKVGTISIEKGSTILFDSTLNALSFDEIIVYGELIIDSHSIFHIVNGTGIDLIISLGGTFNSKSIVNFDRGAKWELSTDATYIHSGSLSGSFGSILSACTNISNGNWVIRKIDKTTPNISFAGRSFKNLTIENFYPGLGSFGVGSSNLGLTVTGILDIGGLGTSPVKLDLRNYTGEIKVGELKIKEGSSLLKN